MRILGSTCPGLLERIRKQVFSGLGTELIGFSRDKVAKMARRIILFAGEPRFNFARCLADRALTEDAWVEGVGSFVISKPPSRWTYAEENSAMAEIDILTATFRRVEAIMFEEMADEADTTAVRLALTNKGGSEAAKVVRYRANDESAVRDLELEIEKALRQTSYLGLATISRIL